MTPFFVSVTRPSCYGIINTLTSSPLSNPFLSLPPPPCSLLPPLWFCPVTLGFSPPLSPLSPLSLSLGLERSCFQRNKWRGCSQPGMSQCSWLQVTRPRRPLSLAPSFSIPPLPRLPLLGPVLNANTPKATEGAMLGLYC